MRASALNPVSFLGGIALGAAASGVAFWALRRRGPAEPSRHVIDGAKPADPVALDMRPLPEAPGEPLESEGLDVDPASQRW